MVHPEARMTIRKKKNERFIPLRFSDYPADIEDWRINLSPYYPTAYRTFEPGHITLSNGRSVHHKHILWVNEADIEIYHTKIRQEVQESQEQLKTQKEPDTPIEQLVDRLIEIYIAANNVLRNDTAFRQRPRTPQPLAFQYLPPFLVDGNGNKHYFTEQESPVASADDIVYTVPDYVLPDTKEEPPLETGTCRTTNHKGISRLDYPEHSTHGYRVVVTWAGKAYPKFFGDARYGDGLAALDAAIEWRNTKEKELGKPRSEHLLVGAARSNTGHIGIHRKQRGSTTYLEVSWVDSDGKPHKTSVSEGKHGSAEALRRAVNLRKAKVAERAANRRGKVI